jgi:hypothetical protein
MVNNQRQLLKYLIYLLAKLAVNVPAVTRRFLFLIKELRKQFPKNKNCGGAKP